MVELKDKLAAPTDPLAPIADSEITPAHREWMNGQIEQALEHKRTGKGTYKTLEEIRTKFGF